MRCKKCMHEIGPEEPRCPYCGTENPYAVQHQKNMKQFKRDYKKTRSEVISSAQKTRGLATRAAILIVLILGCIIITVITSLNYTDPDPNEANRRDAEKHAAEYASEAEEFLKRGEYTEFVSFMYAHNLHDIAWDKADHLVSVNYVAQEYYECIEHMEEIILRSTDPDYFDGLDTDIRNFCMYVDGFYEVLEVQRNRKKSEKYHAYMDDMDAELRAAMRTYFSMDDRALEEFLSKSEAQKAVILEGILRHE